MKQFVGFIICVCMACQGCKDFKEIECTGVQGFQLNKINADGIDGDVLLKLKNPNPIAFSIYRSEFDINYSGVYLGKARLAKKVKIKANAENTYAFNVTNSFKGISLSDVMKLLSGATFKNELEVKGDLNAGKFLVKKKIPLNVKDRIRLQ